MFKAHKLVYPKTHLLLALLFITSASADFFYEIHLTATGDSASYQGLEWSTNSVAVKETVAVYDSPVEETTTGKTTSQWFNAVLQDSDGNSLETEKIYLPLIEEPYDVRLILPAHANAAKLLLETKAGEAFHEVDLTAAQEKINSAQAANANKVATPNEKNFSIVGLIAFLALLGIAIISYYKYNDKQEVPVDPLKKQ